MSENPELENQVTPESDEILNELDGFLSDADAAAAEDAFDIDELEGAGPIITIKTSNNVTRYVPVGGPTILSELLAMTDIRIVGAAKYFLNGAEIGMSTVVPVEQTVTILGSSKGG